jgi:hypothetical protein
MQTVANSAMAATEIVEKRRPEGVMGKILSSLMNAS